MLSVLDEQWVQAETSFLSSLIQTAGENEAASVGGSVVLELGEPLVLVFGMASAVTAGNVVQLRSSGDIAFRWARIVGDGP